MKSKIRIIFLLLIISFYNSCQLIYNNGETEQKVILLNSFSVIESESTFDIKLINDSVNKVIVNCSNYAMEHIKVNIINDTLHLKHSVNNKKNEYDPVYLTIHIANNNFNMNLRHPSTITNKDTLQFSNFQLIDWNEVSVINLNIKVNSFTLMMSLYSFGKFNFTGFCNNAFIQGWGGAYINTSNLITKNAYIRHRGNGEIYLNVTEKLTVSLENTGNVYYKNNHAQVVIEQKLSTGNLIKME